MLDKYPKRFGKGELDRIFNAFPSDTQRKINDFISYCRISAGDRKSRDLRRNIIQFCYIVDCPLDKLGLKELRYFLSLLNHSQREKYTTNGIKSTIKRFLTWHFKDWPERFNDLKDIKLVQAFNHRKINEQTVLNKEDVALVLEREQDLLKKTFFITLYESGLRPQELRLIQWSDVILESDGDISVLHVYSNKTQRSRPVFVKEATKYLKTLRLSSKWDYVFPSRERPGESISKGTACRWIKEVGKNALSRDIFPYLLRHSRATELYGELPTQVAQKFLGHKGDMSNLYSHLSSKKVMEKLKQTVYKTNELPAQTKETYESRIKALETDLVSMKNRLNQWEEKLNTVLLKQFGTRDPAGKLINNSPQLQVQAVERRGNIVLKLNGIGFGTS